LNQTESQPPRILIVEDETMVAMLLEDIVDELGFRVVGPVGRVSQALALLESATIDGAVLDLNLAGEFSYPIADALIARGLPFVFATGYGEAGVDPAYHSRPVVQKPFTLERLQQALEGFTAS
jgi:CheY-like chemotaxis protein